MTQEERLIRAVECLNESVRIMRRNNAMMTLLLGNYRPLARLMIKLRLVPEWIEPLI